MLWVNSSGIAAAAALLATSPPYAADTNIPNLEKVRGTAHAARIRRS